MTFVTNSIIFDILVLILTLAVLLIAYMKWAFTYWEKRNVFTTPSTIPFGSCKDLILQKTSVGPTFKSLHETFKSKNLKFGGMYLIARPIFVPVDLDLIRLILAKDFDSFTDHGNYVNEKNDPLSGHLFSLRGLKWKNLRAQLTPTFTSGKMKMMFQTLVECSHQLEAVLDDLTKTGEDIEMKELVARFTTDVIGSCGFGLEANSLKNPNSEFRKYGKRIFKPPMSIIIKNFICQSMPALADFLKLKLVEHDVEEFFMNIVKQTVDYREQNNVHRKDFMQLLIELKNKGKVSPEDAKQAHEEMQEDGVKQDVGTTLTIEELAAQAFVFFIAGFETSSTTLSFCLFELANNPDVQDKLRKEINTVFDKHGGKLSYEALSEMHYMDMCINETLRKYPPVPALPRQCTKTYKVPDSDVVIEKGTRLFISILGIHHDPEIYPDPEAFIPDRFSEENKSSRHPFAWMPFGEGPRLCIGLRFGVMETKVGLAVLLKSHRFTVNPKTQAPLKMDPNSFVTSAIGGIWLNSSRA